jgi:hypothetical protein
MINSMNDGFWKFFIVFVALVVFSFSSMSFAYGHPHSGMVEINGHSHEPQNVIIPIDEKIGIEKTSVFFHAPADNKLPWGFVEGKIANPVADYPVIIQFYNENGEAAHFAQTDVSDDGLYEYKFRVLTIDHENEINIFEGDYAVFIFKVVYLHPNTNQI